VYVAARPILYALLHKGKAKSRAGDNRNTGNELVLGLESGLDLVFK